MSSNKALITISSLSLICSATTLGLVISGAIKGFRVKKELDQEVAKIRSQTNTTLNKFRDAINEILI